jgi:hypothetical protein
MYTHQDDNVVTDEDTIPLRRVVAGDDILRTILSYLDWKTLVSLRPVSKTWKEAIANCICQDEQIYAKSAKALHGLVVCLPSLESLKLDQDFVITPTDDDDDDNDNDDVNHVHAHVEDPLMLYQFSNLCHFACLHTTSPSLLYPYRMTDLLSRVQNLISLNLHGNEDLEWHLRDLNHLPHVRDVRCINNLNLRGDTGSDLFCNRNLNILDISGCTRITGRLQDFARWPTLEWLGINRTRITGDLRHDIQPGAFPKLQGMGLGEAIYGAYTIHQVQDAPAVMAARHQIMAQSTWDSPNVYPLVVHLSPNSPDYHERIEQRLYSSELDPPFSIEMVMVGSRRGWRWSNFLGGFCDTHWLDPEPGYGHDSEYWEELASFRSEREKTLFSGFMEPPTPQEYRELCRQHQTLSQRAVQ